MAPRIRRCFAKSTAKLVRTTIGAPAGLLKRSFGIYFVITGSYSVGVNLKLNFNRNAKTNVIIRTVTSSVVNYLIVFEQIINTRQAFNVRAYIVNYRDKRNLTSAGTADAVLFVYVRRVHKRTRASCTVRVGRTDNSYRSENPLSVRRKK